MSHLGAEHYRTWICALNVCRHLSHGSSETGHFLNMSNVTNMTLLHTQRGWLIRWVGCILYFLYGCRRHRVKVSDVRQIWTQCVSCPLYFSSQVIKSKVQSDVHFHNTGFVCYHSLHHIYENNIYATNCSPTSQHKRATLRHCSAKATKSPLAGFHLVLAASMQNLSHASYNQDISPP